MLTLDQIREPIGDEMIRYEDFVRRSLGSDYPYVSNILDYIFDNRGKGVRPLLVLLCASLNRGDRPMSDRVYTGAMLVEMVHTASLVHDDVVDEAYMRRGKPSVNALWNSHTAVLVGDYILARSFHVGMEKREFEVVAYITGGIGLLCEGELVQQEQTECLTMTREIYFDIITKKTASLIGVSSAVGALAMDMPEEVVNDMREFGNYLGIAFQIKDDILDYKPSLTTGKPSCGDLRERKITLPLLMVLEQSTPSRRKELISKLADIRQKSSNADYLFNAVEEGNGIVQASEIMEEYLDKAREILKRYPDSPYRRALEQLTSFIAMREK